MSKPSEEQKKIIEHNEKQKGERTTPFTEKTIQEPKETEKPKGTTSGGPRREKTN
jgi:hypothetical protein